MVKRYATEYGNILQCRKFLLAFCILYNYINNILSINNVEVVAFLRKFIIIKTQILFLF